MTSYKMYDGPRVFLLANGIETEIKTVGPVVVEFGRNTGENEWLYPVPLMGYSVECKLTRYVPVLRLFAGRHTKVSRRKVWRYMEYCGL